MTEDGTLAVTSYDIIDDTDDYNYDVWSIHDRRIVHTMHSSANDQLSLSDSTLTPCGKYLVASSMIQMDKLGSLLQSNEEFEDHIFQYISVWDISKGVLQIIFKCFKFCWYCLSIHFANV